jgi:serine/threonine protein kinase
MDATSLTLQPGDQLDHFRIEKVVAHSGMATVYRALDLNNALEPGLAVAIKVPHPEVVSDPVLCDRFQREEDIGKRLNHPGVMKVFANPERSQVYMVMEWIDGRLLRQILNEAEEAARRSARRS